MVERCIFYMKKAKSFRIIPIYKEGENIKILSVRNSKGQYWGLPKGTPEGDEEPLTTAKRELEEDTGITDIEIYPDINFFESYEFDIDGVWYEKTNMYYLG